LLYTGLAVALAVAHWWMKKNFLLILLGQQLKLPATVWDRLNLSWMLYFLFMASTNAYVAHYFSTEAWVNFKLWGYAFPLVFIVGQGLYISRYLPKDDDAATEGDNK
jgi:intracellular septation protein